MHLTMYTHVSLSTKSLRSLLNTASLSGWFVGQDD
jgi:hypothetical protein